MRRIWGFLTAVLMVSLMGAVAAADEATGKGLFRGQWSWVGNVVGVLILVGFGCFIFKQKKGYWPWQKKA